MEIDSNYVAFQENSSIMNPYIKKLLGFDFKTPDNVVREDWEKRTKNIFQDILC